MAQYNSQGKIIERTSAMYHSSGEAITEAKGLPVSSNAQGAVAVTPNDSTDLGKTPTKGIYVGGLGDLKVTLNDDTIVTFTGISSGVIHPIAVKRVFATGTTATAILAVY